MVIDPYNLLRALHIIAVIAWMAGMLMLPRLYAYQTGAAPGGELEKKMIEASRRLRSIIMTPALLVSWGLGLWLLIQFTWGNIMSFWLIAKLVLVVAMTGLHGFFASAGRKLALGERPYSERFWRLMNEVPFIIAIVIVLLAVLEPQLG